MKLSYYQQIKRAIERIERGASVVAYVGGPVEIRTLLPDGRHEVIDITFKMWSKVNNHFGNKLELIGHMDGLYASFKLAA